jgi:hypothetical protein
MVLGSYPRRKDELLAPFATGDKFQNLVVEGCESAPLPDPSWADYELDGDKKALAARQALFFRSVFTPSLASALTQVRKGDNDAALRFADQLQDGMTKHLANHPTPAHTCVQTMVLTKCV